MTHTSTNCIAYLLKLKDKTLAGEQRLRAFRLQFAWTSDLFTADINKTECLADKREPCRKRMVNCFSVVSANPLSPLTPWPLSEIMQCHCHKSHSPTSPLWPMTVHSGRLNPQGERGECTSMTQALTIHKPQSMGGEEHCGQVWKWHQLMCCCLSIWLKHLREHFAWFTKPSFSYYRVSKGWHFTFYC